MSTKRSANAFEKSLLLQLPQRKVHRNAARRWHDSLPLAIVRADPIENPFSTAYSAIPERLAVILDGKIAYMGGKGPYDYSLPEVDRFLAGMCPECEAKGGDGEGDGDVGASV